MFSNSKNLKSNSSHVIRRQLMMYGASTACIALTACGPLLSSNKSEIGQSPTTAVDATYMLPKPQINVQLRKTGDAFTLNVGEPTLIGDATHRYDLVHNRSFFATDALDIGLDEKTGLLTTLNTSTDLQVDESLVALGGAVGALVTAFEAAEPQPTVQIVVDRTIDPTKPAEVRAVVDEMNRVYGAAMHISCAPSEYGTAAMSGNRSMLPAATTPLSGSAKCIQLTFSLDGHDADYIPPSSEGMCSTGICYRPLTTYNVAASMPNDVKGALAGQPNTKNSTVVLPDMYSVRYIDTTRPAFVTRTTNLTMINGSMKTVHTDQPSGFVSAAGTPLRIIQAAFSAVGAVFRSEADAVTQQIALGKARGDLRAQERQQKLEEKKEAASATKIPLILQISNGVAPQPAAVKIFPGGNNGAAGQGRAGQANPGPDAGGAGDPHAVVPTP